MTSIPEAGAPHRSIHAIIARFRDWQAARRERRQLKRLKADLAGLSPYMLRDIGLEDFETPREPAPLAGLR